MFSRLPSRRWQPVDRATYDAIVGLHRVRRRLDVAQLKHEIRRESLRTRRAINAELRQLDERPEP